MNELNAFHPDTASAIILNKLWHRFKEECSGDVDKYWDEDMADMLDRMIGREKGLVQKD